VSPLGYLSIPYLDAVSLEAAASIAPEESLRHSPSTTIRAATDD
jgi:hypothetical protein